tara:strand:+ start:58 stop:1167 length:1110 start_codon:yes stop_codon:yes gene_type:complete
LKYITKNLQKIFKETFFFIFSILYGKIKGVISPKDDSRIDVSFANFENNIKYKVYKIKNARLYTDRIQDTAIILDNKIIEGPSHQLRPINNADVNQNIVFKKGTPRIKKKINGKVLSLLTGGAGNDNYFHWMFDVLPRLRICQEIVETEKIDFFLLPDTVKKYQSESLDKLKIPVKKRLSSKNFRHITASEIIVVDHPYCLRNNADEEIENIPKWISTWLRKACVNQNENLKKNLPTKIYIDRKDSLSNTKKLRSITNENEVKNILSKNGFQFITMSNLSFAEQVLIFNNANTITGLHGAGFANLCFCKPNTKIIEFKSDTFGKLYENLAISNNLDYKSISCEHIGINNNNQFGHIKAPLDLLIKTLEN